MALNHVGRSESWKEGKLPSKPKGTQKAVLVAERKRKRNRSTRRALKTHVSTAEKLIAAGDTDAAKEAMQRAISALDKAARKRVVHRNGAARRKSRLMKKLNKLAEK